MLFQHERGVLTKLSHNKYDLRHLLSLRLTHKLGTTLTATANNHLHRAPTGRRVVLRCEEL